MTDRDMMRQGVKVDGTTIRPGLFVLKLEADVRARLGAARRDYVIGSGDGTLIVTRREEAMAR